MSSKRLAVSLTVGFLVILVLVTVGVGLGVYFYTKSLCNDDDVAQSTTTSATTPMTMTTTTVRNPYGGFGYRLPTALYPTLYSLNLQVYLPSPAGPTYPAEKNFTFDAEITIHITCLQDTDNITLHSLELNYEGDDFFQLVHQNSNETAAKMTEIMPIAEEQTVVFKLDTHLLKNESYRLMLKYNSHLKDDLASFYRANYKDNGMERWLAVTQFESTDARRTLPCFDEPNYKASFDLTMKHPSDLKALSNGPEGKPIDMGDNWSMTTFGRSPHMSSYLLAFGLGDFANGGEAIANNTAAKVKFRVWSRPVLTPKTKFATSAGPFVLGFFEKYFGVKFPLQKQDMLALPKFAPGAMENWGLVTYREKDLLYDERITSPRIQERVAMVIAHELAHQWFGDLVTMAWWNDLWLNEAFAEFLSYRGAAEILQYTFGQEEQWTLQPLQGGLRADEWPSSPAVGSGRGGTGITYEKGASVLQMLNRTIGGDVLQRALTSYLKKHQYGNARSQDLYDELQTEVNSAKLPGVNGEGILNVTDVMNHWVVQPGFPVVTVTDLKPGQITVTQERFLMVDNVTDLPDSPYNYRWHIPLWIRGAAQNSVDMLWVDGNLDEAVLNSSVFTADSWYLLNAEGLGVYRINYPEANWHALSAALLKNPLDLHMRPKAQLIDDAFALAWTGRADYKLAFELISYLRKETLYVPWQAAFNALEELGSVLAQTAEYNTYREYLSWLSMDRYGDWNKPGFEGDNIYLLQQNYRYLMTKIACLLNKDECVKEQLGIFTIYQNACANNMSSSDCNGIHPNIRSVVYCSAVRLMGGPAFSFLLDKYDTDVDYQERTNIIDGLSCAKEPWLIYKLLSATAFGPIVVSQQAFVYRNLKTNPFAPRLSWSFMVDNWNRSDAVHNYELALAATSYMSTEGDFVQVSDFMEDNKASLADGRVLPTLTAQLHHIRANIQWRTNKMDVVLKIMNQGMTKMF